MHVAYKTHNKFFQKCDCWCNIDQ